MRYGDGRGGGAGHFDAHRIVQKGLGEPGDLRRHGGGEKQSLPRERHELADALDIRDEPHVEHPVGFVDDKNLDAGQKQLAAFGKIQKPARRRDQDIGAPHDLGFLIAEGNAANQQRDVELMIDPVAGKTFLDLRGELAGRLEDQGARHPCPGAASFQPRQHRKRESRGLAGAGLGNPKHVASRENLRDRFGLNGGRRDVPRGLDGLENLLAETKFAKCHSVPKKGLLLSRPRREPARSGPPGFEGRVFAVQAENPRNPQLRLEKTAARSLTGGSNGV